MISAMVQAAKCDGTLDDAERERLMQHMGDADPAEVKFVNDLLAAPVDLDGLVRQVPRGMEEQVYLMSLMAIDVDSPAETDYLTRLAQALGIASDRVDDIHRTAGVPHPIRLKHGPSRRRTLRDGHRAFPRPPPAGMPGAEPRGGPP